MFSIIYCLLISYLIYIKITNYVFNKSFLFIGIGIYLIFSISIIGIMIKE